MALPPAVCNFRTRPGTRIVRNCTFFPTLSSRGLKFGGTQSSVDSTTRWLDVTFLLRPNPMENYQVEKCWNAGIEGPNGALWFPANGHFSTWEERSYLRITYLFTHFRAPTGPQMGLRVDCSDRDRASRHSIEGAGQGPSLSTSVDANCLYVKRI